VPRKKPVSRFLLKKICLNKFKYKILSSSKNRPQRGRSIPNEGVYNNQYFMYAATSLVGNTVRITTKSKTIMEGVFRTFSPNFEVRI
jgi:hypothetical protein